MKYLIPYTLILIMGGYIAYSTPAAVQQWRRDIAERVSGWPELQEIQHRNMEAELALAMPPTLPSKVKK